MGKAAALLELLDALKEVGPYLSMSKELRPDFEKVAQELAEEGGEWLKILARNLDVLVETVGPAFDNFIVLRAENLRKYYNALVKAGFTRQQAMNILLAERQNSKRVSESIAQGLSKAAKS